MRIVAPFFVLSSLFLTLTNAVLEGDWPVVDKPPPPKGEWTALVDTTKFAKIPVVKAVGQCVDKDPSCNWSCTLCTRPETDITKCPTKGDWGLTFDDGPTEFTSDLLDYLDTQNVKVTFFTIGSRVHDNPEILQRAVKSGHQIGVHTWSHTALTTQSTEEIIAEIKWTEAAIKSAVGLTPKYMRPPFGDYDDRVRGIASQLGYKIVVWDLDTNDWMSGEDKTYQLDWIEGNFTQWVKQPSTTGHISLEHDLYKQTADRAKYVVPIVKDAGFLIKPVAVCMGDTQPYVENVSLDTSDTSPAPAGTPAGTPADTPADTPANTPAADTPADTPAAAFPSANPYAEESPSTTETSTPTGYSSNGISLNNINLLSFVFLIVGSFIFI